MSELTLKITIHGLVQGVGYRDWMVKAARSLEVDGWVRNCENGTVEALLVGDAIRVHNLIQRCHEGPHFAKVEKITEEVSKEKIERGTFVRKPNA